MHLLKRFSLLRRLAEAQERTATALERLATVAEDTWAKKHAPRDPSRTEIGSLDLEWLNNRFERETEAREAGMELPDE